MPVNKARRETVFRFGKARQWASTYLLSVVEKQVCVMCGEENVCVIGGKGSVCYGKKGNVLKCMLLAGRRKMCVMGERESFFFCTVHCNIIV